MASLRFEYRERPLTVNQIGASRDHWKRSREIQYWRETFYWLGKTHPPLKPPVHAFVDHLRKTRQEVDLCAPLFATKGALDGLVDAGLLPDDGPRYVTQVTFRQPQVVGYDGLAIELVEVDE